LSPKSSLQGSVRPKHQNKQNMVLLQPNKDRVAAPPLLSATNALGSKNTSCGQNAGTALLEEQKEINVSF